MQELLKAERAMKRAATVYKNFERKCEEHTEAGVKAYQKAEETRLAWSELLVKTYCK